ncbi:hypothetical protein [Streptomyces clavuligerus]|uniref:hypothetical protein n=1 Tax=Streptomyces clavuligerus TaxID=1901 RepID=UPI00018515C1|nr:hypothetical protein [Streptomyces clavuligerus]AXU16848.1 hypothetical protein D1794_29225 [Streptomyces clavuligerus]MBY6300982.1 hypothetical protein [Streptomyces clavuligerus]QPJ97007.1 hypothetical protein GE265_28245 [Streptomyces clavuligerus]WDN55792.1 hypothetical protein LL058_28260 [Streptomyces clavuligerus]
MGVVSHSYLTKAQVQHLLGVTTFGMWRLARKYDKFPKPAKSPDNPLHHNRPEPEEAWDATKVYSWAAGTAELAHRGAILLRPAPENPAPGRWGGYQDTVRGPALDWHTDIGVIRLVHCDDSRAATDVATAIASSGNKDGVVTVCALYGDVGFGGPALVAADTAHPGIEYEAGWDDVTAYVGEALPWWPDLLRSSRLIREWKPGAQAAVAEIPANDNETFLRRAAANEVFDVTSRVAATDMANKIRNIRIDHTSHEIQDFCNKGHGDTPNRVIPGALPDTSRHPLPCDGDRKELKAGWRRLALHTHPDAVAALEVAVGREPDLLPFGAVTEIPVQPGTVSDRWTHRLTMCDPTAAHAVLAQDTKPQAFFIDPLTDMPVLRTPGGDGNQVWRFYAPLSLPAGGAELASVVLHHTLWVLTSNGYVHPAPCTPTKHLWWGDGWGDRASEAASVVDQLLNDLGATVDLHKHWDAPKGLTALFNEEHKQGAELTRAALLHARMTPPRTR